MNGKNLRYFCRENIFLNWAKKLRLMFVVFLPLFSLVIYIAENVLKRYPVILTYIFKYLSLFFSLSFSLSLLEKNAYVETHAHFELVYDFVHMCAFKIERFLHFLLSQTVRINLKVFWYFLLKIKKIFFTCFYIIYIFYFKIMRKNVIQKFPNFFTFSRIHCWLENLQIFHEK